jgi:DNA segregation ATPase FtsK/SpoIIIE, S-DNA-T family
MERLCAEGMYASGADNRSKRRTMEILRWLDQECETRGPLIRTWAAKGLNSQNKLNRAIAQADPRLQPIVGVFDELQELITDPELGKEAKALLTSIVKRGRSLGIHLILATQRIDKESVPKDISSNVSNRPARPGRSLARRDGPHPRYRGVPQRCSADDVRPAGPW